MVEVSKVMRAKQMQLNYKYVITVSGRTAATDDFDIAHEMLGYLNYVVDLAPEEKTVTSKENTDRDLFTCLKCDKEFKNERGLKIHEGRIH